MRRVLLYGRRGAGLEGLVTSLVGKIEKNGQFILNNRGPKSLCGLL